VPTAGWCTSRPCSAAGSLLGTLYEKGDARCDGGFTLFYLGINLGAFIGPLITGLLQTRVGFHYGFGAAAIGIALGLAQYVAFRRNLGAYGRNIPNSLPRSAIGWAVGVAVIVAAFVTGLIKLSNLSQVTTGVIVAAAVAYFVVMLTSSKVAPIERTRMRAFIPLFIANAVFWSLFQQIFTVLAVYSDERMNWSIFGWTAPSNWIASIEPVWIIALSPFFAIMWTRLGNRAPTTPRKFAYGVIGMGWRCCYFCRCRVRQARQCRLCLSSASWRYSRSASSCSHRSGSRSPQSLRRKHFGPR
jgi:proton-dependent oligopeptide transporter, POT family